MDKVKKQQAREERQAAKQQRLRERSANQAPIIANLKRRNNSCKQEIGCLLRGKTSIAVLYENPDPIILRYCLPGYPNQWIKLLAEIQPAIDYINREIKRTQLKKPIFTNNIGGYFLIMLRDEASAEFVSGLQAGMAAAMKTNLRVPLEDEIAYFHATWMERSPKMFSRFGKGGQPLKQV